MNSMDEKLEKAIAGNEKLAKLVSEAEKMGIKIVVADEDKELPKALEFEQQAELARMIEYKMPPVIPLADYPSGQENRRKRREMERKNKKRR